MSHYDRANVYDVLRTYDPIKYFDSSVVDQVVRSCNDSFEHFLRVQGKEITDEHRKSGWVDILDNHVANAFFDELE